MTCILKIKELFADLENFTIALIKTNVPYMPSNFPKTYAIGKDIDMVIQKKDMDDIRMIFEEFSQNYRDEFNIICLDEQHGFRVRFQEGNKLHFQFDVKWEICGSEKFTKELLENRKSAGEYFIADSIHELIVRLKCYTPNKEYHFRYIEDNIRFLDAQLVPDKLRVKTMDIMKEIICK